TLFGVSVSYGKVRFSLTVYKMKKTNLAFIAVLLFGFLLPSALINFKPEPVEADHGITICADGVIIAYGALGNPCADHGGIIHPGNPNLFIQCSDGIYVFSSEGCDDHGGECGDEGCEEQEPEAPPAITCADGTVVTRGGPIPDDQLCDGHGGPADPAATETSLTCEDGTEG